MKTLDYIPIIEKAFEGMKQRKEKLVIVRLFEHLEQITLSSGNIMQVSSVQISMLCENNTHKIKVLYPENTIHELLPFVSDTEKVDAVLMLRKNNIMPTFDEWKQARSLANIPKIATFLGCDFCE
jgi:hypothetical protein